jgi:hypothetical protein
MSIPANIITTQGIADVIAGASPQFVSWGTGAGTSSPLDTTLFTESKSSLNDTHHNLRITGTSARQVTVIPDVGTLYTVTVSATITADTLCSLTNVGVFDTNGQSSTLLTPPSGGDLFFKSNFDPIQIAVGNSFVLLFDARILVADTITARLKVSLKASAYSPGARIISTPTAMRSITISKYRSIYAVR